MSWTAERVERLTALWKEGKTASQIAEELGSITRNAVIGKAHRLGLSGRPSPIKKGGASTERKRAAKAEAKAAKPRARKPQAPRRAEPQRKQEKPSRGAAVVTLPPRPPAEDGAAVKCFGPGLSIMDLTERTCRWPVGDPKSGDFRYCGHSIQPGEQYCAQHAAIAFQAPQSRREQEQQRAAQLVQHAAQHAAQKAADEAAKKGGTEPGAAVGKSYARAG